MPCPMHSPRKLSLLSTKIFVPLKIPSSELFLYNKSVNKAI
jgi:hypothetical protein